MHLFHLKTHSLKKAILFAIFSLFSAQLFAQDKLEIVIVGSAHSNTSPDDIYRPIIEKLKNYNPDMVFGEYLSPADLKEAIAAGHYSSESINKKMEYLKSRDPKSIRKTATIPKAYKSLNKFAFYHKTRMDLARSLYLNHDRGNAEYQFYVLDQHMRDKLEKSEQAYFAKIFGGIDSLRKVGFIRKNSEYQRIYFPLIYAVGHDRIYAADCQKYDKPWSEASVKADSLIKQMNTRAKVDSLSPEAVTVKSIKTYMDEGTLRMQGIDYTSYSFLNSPLYAELDEFVNFLGGERFYNSPAFPTEAIKEMKYWWKKRNEGICENIIRQAKEKGAKRIVVAIGSSHRRGMEEILAKMPDVKLMNYNDLPEPFTVK